jgi:hypothetical protein
MKRRKAFKKAIGMCKMRDNALYHIACPKGGHSGIAIDGYGYRDLPLGFGFRGNRFVVDCARQRIYIGFCMDCQAEGDFILNRKATLKTKTPRSINRRLQALRAS